MFGQIKKVLILAPHPDDAEFGLGGTIAKLIADGKEVHVAVMSTCEKSTPQGFEKGVIIEEMYKSCAFLGIQKEHIHTFDFEVRDFPALRQDILETFIQLRTKIKPDLVFVPSSSDIHQDHATVHQEGMRAFKYACLLGYEMPWNNFGFTSYVFVKLSSAHLDKKIAALNLYESQKHRSYSNIDFVKSLAHLRGGQIQQEYAESFELIRFFDF
jgi:LmbE family N-acetylglucosaminyl deacetylase